MDRSYHAGQVSQQSLFSDVDYIELQQLSLFDPESPVSPLQTPSGLKKCATCGDKKSLDDFPRNKNVKPDGRDSRCKACRKEYHADYRKEHVEQQAEHNRKRMSDPVRREAHNKQVRDAHREKLIAQGLLRTPKPGHKFCNECDTEKPFKAFNKCADIKDGYAGKCKECARAYYQEYREAEASKPPEPLPDSKVCRACGEEKSIDQYHINSGKPLARCKECVRAYDRSRDLQHNPRKKPPKPRATKQGYKVCNACFTEKRFAEFNKNLQQKDGYSGKCRECNKEFWANRPPEEKKSQRERRNQLEEARRDAIRSYDQARLHTPQRQITKRSQAVKRKAAMSGIYTEEVDYGRVLERDGYHCYICNQDILPHQKLAFDHVIPLIPRAGEPIGTHTEDNIHVSHWICNARKSNRQLEDLTSIDKRGPDC